MNANPELESLLARLDELLVRSPRGDAIDAVLSGSPRTTAAPSLRQHETILRFRHELSEGLIAADTASQFLGLLRTVLETVVRP